MAFQTTDLFHIDTALRLIAIGEMLMVALVVARSGASAAIRRGTVLLLAGVIGYLVHSVGGPVAMSTPMGFVALIGATATPLALWLFAHALFDDTPDARIALASAAILIASVVAPVIGGWCLIVGPWLDRLGHLVMALLVIDAELDPPNFGVQTQALLKARAAAGKPAKAPASCRPSSPALAPRRWRSGGPWAFGSSAVPLRPPAPRPTT